MESIKINAVGIACPMPVILTKKEFDKMDKGVVEVIADNKTCVENLKKYAKSNGFSVKDEEIEENRFLVTIEKSENASGDGEGLNELLLDNFVVAVGTDEYGKGDEALCKQLMKMFIYTVSETSPYPKAMVFYNHGVRLTIEGSPVLDDLKKLAENGVKILSCGACLDFYEVKDKLAVGEVSNMYTIYETIREAERNMILG